jgi:leucyl-tRNA synthetase
MSKSMYNVVNPDKICADYGADTLRLYEMFLGPLEQSKPWDTKGIDGVHRFLRKFYRMFLNEAGEFCVSDEKASAAELKTLHKLIEKESWDIEHFSFNTTVSAFMIAVNDLAALGCNKREILEPMVILISPFAPHVAEELWSLLGHKETITYASFPEFNPAYTVEDSFEYPVSFNGKLRFKITLAKSLSQQEAADAVRSDERTAKYLNGGTIKKIIVVPSKIINVVC